MGQAGGDGGRSGQGRGSGQRAAGLWSRADWPPDRLDRKLVGEGWRLWLEGRGGPPWASEGEG